MSEKELEARILINKKQYLEIANYIKENYPNAVMIHQKNRYFDDDKFTLKNNHNVLRIRSFKSDENRELTYKVHGDEYSLEHNQTISYYWLRQILNNSRLPEGEVKESLLKDGVNINKLKMLTDLKTRRIEVQLQDHLFVLDINMYNNIVDYNIEVESKISKSHAVEMILKYCKQFNLTYKEKCPTKSERAFKSIGL